MDKNDIIAANDQLKGKVRNILKPIALKNDKTTFESVLQRVRIGRYKNQVYGLTGDSGEAMVEAINFIESRDPSLFRDDIDENYFAVNRLYCDVYPCLQGYIACRIDDVNPDQYLHASFQDTNPSISELDEMFKKHLHELEYRLVTRYYGLDGTRDNYNRRLCESKTCFIGPMMELFHDVEKKPSTEQIQKMLNLALAALYNVLPERSMLITKDPIQDYAKRIEDWNVPGAKLAVIEAERQLQAALHNESFAIENEDLYIANIRRISYSKCQLAKSAEKYLKRGFTSDYPLTNFAEKEPRIVPIIATLKKEMRITTIRDLAREKYSRLRESLTEFDLVLLQNVLLKAGYTGWEEDISEEQWKNREETEEDNDGDDYEYDECLDSDFFEDDYNNIGEEEY